MGKGWPAHSSSVHPSVWSGNACPLCELAKVGKYDADHLEHSGISIRIVIFADINKDQLQQDSIYSSSMTD